MATLVFWGLLFALKEWKKSSVIVSAVASVLLVLFYLQYPVRDLLAGHRFEQNAIVLWFVGVWAVTVFEAKIRPRAGDWEKTAFLVLGALFVFALFYYPHIKSSWGGGTPVPATIYFGKDSVVKPNQPVSAQLIEESDQGFYIVAPNEQRAVFVPRNSVSLIYFGDKANESALLH